MSSIPTKQIDGDVAVGRNVSAGGDVNIQGSARIGHNLRVEGWLDAPNIKGVLKGFFPTLESLKAAYPLPKTGWLALVGEEMPATIYYGAENKWNSNGATCGEISADASALIETLKTQVGNQEKTLSFLYRTLDRYYTGDVEVAVATGGGYKLVLHQHDPVDDSTEDKEVALPLAGLPVEVASEEAMAALIASGNAVAGQLYFIAEEE